MAHGATHRRRLLAEARFLGHWLERAWLADFGPRLTGEPLWRALGFGSRRAFERAAEAGQLTVALYPLPAGRGRYARTDEVARTVWREIQGRLAGGACTAVGDPTDETLSSN